MTDDAGVDFRAAPRRCGLCDVETPPTKLGLLGGHQACPRCREDLNLMCARDRYDLSVRQKITEQASFYKASFNLEIRRPTWLDAMAFFGPESRGGFFDQLFSKEDPQAGDPPFDDAVRVWLEESFGEQVMRMLQLPGLRRAILDLIVMGCKVELTGSSIFIHDADKGGSDTLADMALAKQLGVALGVHVERFARTYR